MFEGLWQFSYISPSIWNDLIDIVNLRNMMVHNNGLVDNRFTKSSTYKRWKDRVNTILIRIEEEDISKFVSSVINTVAVVSNLYLKEYYERRNKVIANYYFNGENGNTDLISCFSTLKGNSES